jgi:putative restriction endonuclease
VRAYVGVTDSEWFDLLAGLPSPAEVNFWQPGGNKVFKTLEAGGLFLFKPHRRDFVCGGGFFAHATLLPVSLAWEAFGEANGAHTIEEMRGRVAKYRRAGADRRDDYTIGCILLEQPFFLPEGQWVPIPDWKPNIVQGRGYDLTVEPGLGIWRQLQEVLQQGPTAGSGVATPAARYGEPVLVAPRLGQGGFRVLVTDAYQRRCALTGERTLPVLEAAHIRPYTDGGEHRVDNGLLLRSDLHVLFDRGYLTVTPELRVEVSNRIREEFENGKDYYALHGNDLRAPVAPRDRPSASALRWHNESVFRR